MKQTFNNIKKSFKFIKIKKSQLILLIIGGIITSFISSFIPSINGMIVNNILKLNYNKIIFFAILAGIFQVLNTFFSYEVNNKYLKIRTELILNIRKRLCQDLINFKVNNYDSEGVGTLLNKIKNDSRMIANFLNDIKDGILGLIFNIGIIIYIFYLNYIIGIYYFIILLISIIIRYYGIKKSLKYQKLSILEGDKNDNNLSEIIKGQKDIKLNNLKNKFLNKNIDELNTISNYLYKSNQSHEFFSSMARLSESIFSGIMVILGVILVKNNLLTAEKFIIIFMYKGNVFLFPTKFSSLINSFEKFNISCERIFSVFNNQKEQYGTIDTDLKGDIEFKNICFYYDEKNVIFSNLNLKIKKNSYTVILGKNGIGKSTILNLISKIIEPLDGNIYIDKLSLKNLSEDTIRNNIVLISQQPYLFNFSILENLSLVNSDTNKIIEVCKLVGIHDKIMSFKDKYNTKIGSDACNLSGGEKQKLAIARALLSNAKILLFDEITNNLDKESINAIDKIITELKGKYTIIMITHGNILSKPDQIIEIKNSKKVQVIK